MTPSSGSAARDRRCRWLSLAPTRRKPPMWRRASAKQQVRRSRSASRCAADCSASHLRRAHSVEPSRVPRRASLIFVKSSLRPLLTRRAAPSFRRRSLQRCRLRRPTPRPPPRPQLRPRPSHCASHLASNARAQARGQRLTRFHSDPISHHAVAVDWNPFALRRRLRRRSMQRVKFSPTLQARCAK